MLLRFAKEFTSNFSIILWLAAALAFFAEWSAPGQGMLKIGAAIVVVIVVSGLFSFWQEFRVERTLAALMALLPQQVNVLREGQVARLGVDQLVPGDIVLLGQGDNVPADCRLIEAFGVRVQNAAITGESLPKARDAAPSAAAGLLQSKNVVFAGTAVVSGEAKAVVFATGARTEFGRIAHLVQTAGREVSPLRREVAHLSRITAILAVLIGAVFFAIGWAIGIAFWQAFMFAIGIIVAMVPEGLLPTLTLALVLATQRMAKRDVLIRYLPSVEALGSTTVICTDKTGTLTQNRMVAKELLLGSTTSVSVADLKNNLNLVGLYRPFFSVALMCQDLIETRAESRQQYLGDPMEVALVEMALAVSPDTPADPLLDKILFDAGRMCMSTVHRTSKGIEISAKGALEAILPRCDRLLVDGVVQPLDGACTRQIGKAQESMARRGLRVLALAFRRQAAQYDHEHVEEQLVFAGLVGLDDPPRPEVPAAIFRCREAGIRVIMVTGDHPLTAGAIAREIGLSRSDNPRIITGDELRTLTPSELQLALDAEDVIFARVAANQKMHIVEAFKRKKHIVAVAGDGVNDAPALKCAHIGIAMGVTGTDVAKDAADMVLLDDNFASIVNAVEEGRAVFENIRKFLTYVLAHNVAELVPYLTFVLLRIPLALTPIQALSVDMGTDTLTALGLGVERPDPGVMRQPPRAQTERLMNWALAFRAYLFLGLIEAGIAMAAFLFVLRHAGWTYGQVISIDDPTYLRATTACLSAIITMQIVNVFLCRSSTKSLLRTGLRGNRLLGWGVVTEIALLLLINYAPWVNDLLGTRGLDARTWLFLAPFGALMLVLEELRKAFVRRGSTTAEHGREQGRQRNVSPIRDLDQARPDTQHDD
jgi:calcium-translocating P-type ATPase